MKDYLQQLIAYQAEQPIQSKRLSWIVSAIMKRRNLLIVPVIESFLEVRSSGFCLSTNRLKISWFKF
jgi:hypothetical protein